MEFFELIKCDDKRWDEIVKSFPNHDVYYLRSYVKAFEIHGDGEPLLIYYHSRDLKGIYVAMKRDIATMSFFEGKLERNRYFDLISPYGYGGFLFDGNTSDSNLEEFRVLFLKLMKQENVVTDFVRYHPVLSNADKMRKVSRILDLGKTVVIDLSSADRIWENITSKNRNMIRKAEKNGVEIKHGKEWALFKDFIKIYCSTMDRDAASSYYYFKDEFYFFLHTVLNDNYEMFYAVYEGKIIAMSIMIFANGQMHYHLSGSLCEYRSLAPSNLLLYKAALWGCEQGFKTFHLGGGVGSGEDNLYKFKAGFNRNSNCQFSIGMQIFNQEKYDLLINERKSSDNSFNINSTFFPLYRS